MKRPGSLIPAFRALFSTGRRPAKRKANVALESLEGRALLSHASPHIASHLAVGANVISLPHGPQLGPVVTQIGDGYVVKSPRFYAFYTGAKRAELNAGGARAYVDPAGNLNLVGILAGPLVTEPSKPSEEAWYTWGFDLGRGTAIAPFRGRPNIKFDTVLVVGVTQTGISGQIVDLATGSFTDLNPSTISTPNARGANNMIVVKLPADAVAPIGSTLTTAPKAVFWASSAPPSTDSSTVASFAPEFRNMTVATPLFRAARRS